MKLTLELDEWAIAELQDALRVLPSDYNTVVVCGHTKPPSRAIEYALRMMRVRKALGLDTSYTDSTEMFTASDA